MALYLKMWSRVLIVLLVLLSDPIKVEPAPAEDDFSPGKIYDAFYKMEAEDFDSAVEAQANHYCEGLVYMSNTVPTAAITYNSVDFGSGAELVTVRVWGYNSFAGPGSLDFRLGNTSFASVPVDFTGLDDCAFITLTSFLDSEVSGVDSLFLTFSAPSGLSVAGVDWFYFNHTII